MGCNYSSAFFKIMHRHRLENTKKVFQFFTCIVVLLNKHIYTTHLSLHFTLFNLIYLHPNFWSFHFCITWYNFYKSCPLSRFKDEAAPAYNTGIAYPSSYWSWICIRLGYPTDIFSGPTWTKCRRLKNDLLSQTLPTKVLGTQLKLEYTNKAELQCSFTNSTSHKQDNNHVTCQGGLVDSVGTESGR